ncbi:MAG: flagellar hook-length control protein FliK [Nitrospinae bacterium]|nr:flagellar hook-length control protein FliK [Nitrospinota bacterium]
MIESLMTDLLAGAARGVVGSFAGGAAQGAVADQSFAAIFASVQKNDQNVTPRETSSPRPEAKETDDDRGDDQRAVKSDKSQKAESASQDDRDAEEKPALSADAMAAKIMARLDQLKAENPDAYAALMEQAGQMSMNDFLTQLGFTGEEIGQFAQSMNLDVAVSEELKNGLAQGDLAQTAQSLLVLTGKDDAVAIDNVGGNAELAQDEVETETVKAPVAEARPQEVRQENASAKQPTAEVRPQEARQEQSTDTPKDQQGQGNPESKKEARPEGMVSSLADTESRAAMKEAALDGSKEKAAAKTQAAAPQTPAAEQAAKGAEQEAAGKLVTAPAAAAASADKGSAAAPRAGSTDTTGVANTAAKGEAASAEALEKSERAAAPRRDFERLVMAQVVEKARIGFRPNGASQMTMRLDPPHLGKIDMRVMVKDDSVKAIMVAESPEVKAAIERNLDQLRQQLSNAGMKVDELTVVTADERQGMAFGQAQADGRNGAHGAGRNRGADAASTIETDEANAPSGRDPRHEGLLSIVA